MGVIAKALALSNDEKKTKDVDAHYADENDNAENTDGSAVKNGDAEPEMMYPLIHATA